MTYTPNKVYEVKTGPGGSLGLHLAVSYCDAPTFTLENVSGQQIHWRVDLCEEVTHEEEVEYWRERALAAESRAMKS